MENIDNPVPKWHAFTKSDLEKLTKDELIDRLLELQKYLESVGSNRRSDNWNTNPELVTLRESEEKLKQQQIEATRKENVLVMRLTSKEQEMQEYVNQIQELKQSQMPSVSQLRSMLTDPAINLLFKGLKKELENTKAKLEETQNELSAWKFTPDRCESSSFVHRATSLAVYVTFYRQFVYVEPVTRLIIQMFCLLIFFIGLTIFNRWRKPYEIPFCEFDALKTYDLSKKKYLYTFTYASFHPMLCLTILLLFQERCCYEFDGVLEKNVSTKKVIILNETL